MRIKVHHLHTPSYLNRQGTDFATPELADEYRKITIRGDAGAALNAASRGLYRPVAICSWVDEYDHEADVWDALEAAWEMTNNIVGSWINAHDNCTAIGDAAEIGQCRSSSVGDLFEVDFEDGEPTQFYITASCGFDKFDLPSGADESDEEPVSWLVEATVTLTVQVPMTAMNDVEAMETAAREITEEIEGVRMIDGQIISRHVNVHSADEM